MGPVGGRRGDYDGRGVAPVWGEEGAEAGEFGADFILRVPRGLRKRG